MREIRIWKCEECGKEVEMSYTEIVKAPDTWFHLSRSYEKPVWGPNPNIGKDKTHSFCSAKCVINCLNGEGI